METSEKGRFPLRDAYTFTETHGFSKEASEIRNMEIEWDRSYTSTVRRGKLIALLQAKGLLDKFVGELWSTGRTSWGEREIRSCLRIAREHDNFVAGKAPPDDSADQDDTAEALEFAIEAHLRDFLARNLDKIEPGLRLYAAEGRSGIEFQVDDGRIDILAMDRESRFCVVELKLSRGRNKTLGQLLYYMGWVDKHLGKGPCRGIIIASEITDDLVTAAERVPGVMLAEYKMSFAIERLR